MAAEGDGDLAEVVRRSGLGRLHPDGEHVVVDPVALRALAGPAAASGTQGFAGMCAYAAGKGWVEDDGGVLAHIEPPGGGLSHSTAASLRRRVARAPAGLSRPAGRRYPWVPPGPTGGGARGPQISWGGCMAIRDYDRLFIGGDWVAPEGTDTIGVISPSTEEVIARVPDGTEADIDKAVAAARHAFDHGPWPRMTPAERAEVLAKVAAQITAEMGDLAEIITQRDGLADLLLGAGPGAGAHR